MIWKPYRHQQIALDFCREHPHCGLFLGMGLGKTVTSLTVLVERLWDEFTVKQCLVVAPLNVAKNVWAQECRKWDHLKDVQCSIICGTAKQRETAVESPAPLHIINRENLVWLSERVDIGKKYQMVILDELSSFKSPQAKRFKAIRKTIQKVPYVIGLTGTPAPNSYLDLWSEIFLLDGGERLGEYITRYRERYFHSGAHKGNVVYEYKLNIGAQDAINRKLSDLCLSMKSEDWIDLPPVIYNDIPVTMDPAARKLYDRFEKEKVIPIIEGKAAELKDVENMESVIDGATAATVAGKLLQMAGGNVYDDSGGIFHIHDAKVQALKEFVEACNGEPILCFYNYQHEKDAVLEAIHGATPFEGTDTVERWNRGEIPLLLCHPASVGFGINLQEGGHITVWYGLTWSLELYEQACCRLSRPGQKESVIIHHLICKDTIDERVMDALSSKGKTQNALLEALKGYIKEGIA